MSLLLLFKPIYRPMKAAHVAAAAPKGKKFKRKKQPVFIAPSIEEFVKSLTAPIYARLKKEEERATKIQENVRAQLEKLKRQWQEDEESLIAAFLFDLI